MNRTTNKNHQTRIQNSIKDVEPKIEYNSNLPESRFHGISMQRRPSYESNITKNNSAYNKSQPISLSAKQLLSSSAFKQSSFISSKQNSNNNSFIRGTTDFSIEFKTNQKKKTFWTHRKIFLCSVISLLIILIIVLSIILPLKLARSETTSSPHQTTSQNLACTSGGLVCSTPIFQWNYYCNPVTYNYYSCCYLSPISTQLTIEFELQEDISHWSIDDISATQNNGELITNGGFESNLNGWILTIPSSATSTTYVQYLSSASHTGLAYLYGGSQNAPASLKQTFNVIQGQNINISFWWADQGSSVYIPSKICQATVKIT